MNDTHDAGHRPNRPHVQWNNFKEDNPQYLFGNMGEKLPYGRWSAVDYSYPEIRDLCVQYYTEVCENYDVDGIELDFSGICFYLRMLQWEKLLQRHSLKCSLVWLRKSER